MSSTVQFRWLLLLAVLSSPLTSNGQHTSAVKAHTLRVIGGLYTMGIEQALSKNVSVELLLQGGNYIDMRPNRFDDYEVKGIGAIGAMRYYPFTNNAAAPQGFFGYVAFRYVTFEETYRNTAFSDRYIVGGKIMNAGPGLGYKFIYRRVGLEAFIGWGAGRVESEDVVYRNRIPRFFQSSIEEQAHFPQLDLALCYMFTAVNKH